MIVAVVMTTGCGSAPATDTGASDASVDQTAAGDKCTMDQQCSSGLCERGRCTKTCSGPDDCLPGPQWTCETARKACSCTPLTAGAQEVCNGQDDDCDGQVDDGKLCPPDEVCSQGACVCSQPLTRCNGTCVDTSKSVEHCGACDKTCTLPATAQHASPACVASKCGLACAMGYGDCDKNLNNGCELSLLADDKNCGACGKTCTGSCLAGACCDHPKVVKSCSNGWCTIPAGCYYMGSPPTEPCRDLNYDALLPYVKDPEQQHPVRLTRSFSIAQTEVTQGQFKQLMGYATSETTSPNKACVPWWPNSCYCGSIDTCDLNPVDGASWHEAAAYCNALSKRKGLTACYTCSGSGTKVNCLEKTGYKQHLIYSCPGYRLPTEAEWEYAYRAGTTTAYYSGPNDKSKCGYPTPTCINDPNLDPIAWYSCNKTTKTHKTATKQPNGWGLYDMAGNVAEWANDWFGAYSPSVDGSAVTDPGSVAASSAPFKGRAVRSIPSPPYTGRAARRISSTPDGDSFNGFRCVRTIKPSP